MALKQNETTAEARTRRAEAVLKFKNQQPSGKKAVALGGDVEILPDGRALYTTYALDAEGAVTHMPAGAGPLSDIVVSHDNWVVTHDLSDGKGLTLIGTLLSPLPTNDPVAGVSVSAKTTLHDGRHSYDGYRTNHERNVALNANRNYADSVNAPVSEFVRDDFDHDASGSDRGYENDVDSRGSQVVRDDFDHGVSGSDRTDRFAHQGVEVTFPTIDFVDDVPDPEPVAPKPVVRLVVTASAAVAAASAATSGNPIRSDNPRVGETATQRTQRLERERQTAPEHSYPSRTENPPAGETPTRKTQRLERERQANERGGYTGS